MVFTTEQLNSIQEMLLDRFSGRYSNRKRLSTHYVHAWFCNNYYKVDILKFQEAFRLSLLRNELNGFTYDPNLGVVKASKVENRNVTSIAKNHDLVSSDSFWTMGEREFISRILARNVGISKFKRLSNGKYVTKRWPGTTELAIKIFKKFQNRLKVYSLGFVSDQLSNSLKNGEFKGYVSFRGVGVVSEKYFQNFKRNTRPSEVSEDLQNDIDLIPVTDQTMAETKISAIKAELDEISNEFYNLMAILASNDRNLDSEFNNKLTNVIGQIEAKRQELHAAKQELDESFEEVDSIYNKLKVFKEVRSSVG